MAPRSLERTACTLRRVGRVVRRCDADGNRWAHGRAGATSRPDVRNQRYAPTAASAAPTRRGVGAVEPRVRGRAEGGAPDRARRKADEQRELDGRRDEFGDPHPDHHDPRDGDDGTQERVPDDHTPSTARSDEYVGRRRGVARPPAGRRGEDVSRGWAYGRTSGRGAALVHRVLAFCLPRRSRTTPRGGRRLPPPGRRPHSDDFSR